MQRLVLLGGGHAHVQVVRAFGAHPPDAEVVLVNRSRLTPYSGMLPGLIAGHYAFEECHIDLAALCARTRVRFVEATATAVDPDRRVVVLDDQRTLGYDLLAIDTGSTPPLGDVTGASARTTPVKPIEQLLRALDAMRFPADAPAARVAVVGAGAAGFEVALALDHRFRHTRPVPRPPSIRLLADTEAPLPAFPRGVRRRAAEVLRERGVALVAGARVAAVEVGNLLLADGRRIGADHVIWATGGTASPMFAASTLATDATGSVEVDACLRSISHPDVYASGDAAHVGPYPRPKAGVFAVRQGPPLTANLRRALAGDTPRPFVPQRRFLVLLSTGRKHAIAVRGDLHVAGEWVWRWKDHIDRRFVEGFRPPTG